MDYILENKELKVTISTRGAEVTSVIDKHTGRQLIWDGQEKFWSGHGPILFPACGGLWNGEYIEGDKRIQLPKHGFVRKSEWTNMSQKTDNEKDLSLISFCIEASDDSLKGYPFHFRLTISYLLKGRELKCNYTIENQENNCVMPYQIGGHPSVMLPDYQEGAIEPIGYLQPVTDTNKHETGKFTPIDARCLSLVRVGEQGCWRPERYPAPADQDGLIPITVDTFAHEALIFDRQQARGFCVLDAKKQPLATTTSKAPVFLIWQPQGLLSPFVCIEPWFGLCDQEGHSTSLIERPYSQCVLPGDQRQGTLYTLTF